MHSVALRKEQKFVHTSVNGMSNGGSIDVIEEIVIALTSLYSFDLGIELEKKPQSYNKFQR